MDEGGCMRTKIMSEFTLHPLEAIEQELMGDKNSCGPPNITKLAEAFNCWTRLGEIGLK